MLDVKQKQIEELTKDSSSSTQRGYPTPYGIDLSLMPRQEDLQKYMDAVLALPERLQDLLTDELTAQKIHESVGDQLGLSYMQSQDLTRIVRDVMLSSVYLGDLPQEVQQRLHIDEVLARKVANELVEQIFQPAMEDIKKIQIEHFKDRIQGQPEGSVINLRK